MKGKLTVGPGSLMCLFCLGVGGFGKSGRDARLKRLGAMIGRDPERPVEVACRVSGLYSFQNPPAGDEDGPGGILFRRRRELEIIQRLRVVPGTTMPARFLLEKVIGSVDSSRSVCAGLEGGPQGWSGCPLSDRGFYEEARRRGLSVLVPPRPGSERLAYKEASVAEMMKAGRLRIRPHHLVCMACFVAGRENPAPLEEDNLQEAVEIIRANPRIPVELVEGPCMICPPCHSYRPRGNACTGSFSMDLRDEKKDLDVLFATGLEYGSVRPAVEMYRLVFEALDSARSICGFRDGLPHTEEWRPCPTAESDSFARSRRAGLGVPGLSRAGRKKAGSEAAEE